MLVTFSTNSYADITLFGDVALTLLKMMGHSATVPGAILTADIPCVLHRYSRLTGLPLVLLPSHQEDRFSCSVLKPVLCSCPLYAGCRPARYPVDVGTYP